MVRNDNPILYPSTVGMKTKSDYNNTNYKNETNAFWSISFVVFITIFFSELLIRLLIQYLHVFSNAKTVVIDAIVLSLLLAPVIYYFLYLPLKRSILDREERNKNYYALIENMAEGVCICDPSERFVFVNPALEKIFNVQKGELIGISIENYFSKEDFEFIVNQSTERKKGASNEYQSEILLKDGSRKTILITASPHVENGKYAGTLAILRDITALMKAEASIKFERNLLRTLIDTLPEAVYVKDQQFKKVIANPVDVNYMGFTTEADALGKDDYEVYSKEIAEGSFAEDKAIFENGQVQLNKEGYFIDNKGKERWMLNSKIPIKDNNGHVVGLVGIAKDITEKKKEETRLKLMESVITNATDAVIITEKDPKYPGIQKIIFVNDSYLKITGYTRAEIIGQSSDILQGSKSDKLELKKIEEHIRKNEPCEIEIINYRKNGIEFWASMSICPVADNDGNYTHWIAIMRDITERKLFENELMAAKEKAESGSKAKSEFLANMSHEIRTPLNSVIGFSDLVLKTQLNDTQHQYISAIYQSANSLMDIINSILDYSKIEAGKLEIDVDKTDVFDLANHCTDVISFQAAKKSLEVLLNMGVDVPRFIWADAVRLRQVLINLLANAVKFTASGEVELKIETLLKGTDGKQVFRFSVRDTGIGIAPANQKRIFDAFSQEDASTNRKFGGTGLGLAISKKLLNLMGSDLKLSSIPGQGSTFYFDLYLKTMYGEVVEWTNNFEFKKVLIVDDNANNRRILKDMLAIKMINSDEVDNGQKAFEKLKAGKKYDLVLMDFLMPELSGLETIKKIRSELHLNESVLPIMLLHSSAEDSGINKECKEWGVAQRLLKPIKIKQLFEAVASIGKKEKYNNEEILNIVIKKEEQIVQDNYKVLIVDDNPFNILLIKTIIGDILPDATIIEAEDGGDAVSLFQEYSPELVFMDIQMPLMNGYEATRQIRNSDKGKVVPIIALTAGTLNDEMVKCKDAGMDDYVSKPFVSSTILKVIHKYLDINHRSVESIS